MTPLTYLTRIDPAQHRTWPGSTGWTSSRRSLANGPWSGNGGASAQPDSCDATRSPLKRRPRRRRPGWSRRRAGGAMSHTRTSSRWAKGLASRNLHQRRFKKRLTSLREMLARCPDDGFLQLAWAVNMLQSDVGTDVRPYLRYPLEAAATHPDSPYAIHKWEIETLLTVLLTTTKRAESQSVRFDVFDVFSGACNLLRSIEDDESAMLLQHENFMLELHRIAHRQFGWQRGFASTERLYRFVYVYAQGACADFFERKYGISVQDFLRVGFLLFTQLHRSPWTRIVSLDQLGVDLSMIERSLRLLSRSLPEIRSEARALIDRFRQNSPVRVAYLPSALRQFPIITSPEHGTYISPLPQLIMLRITTGLYYDLVDGPQNLINEANGRFEEYVRILLKGFFTRFEILPSQPYGTKKAPKASPDILIKDGDQIVAIIECKATKLTHEAQFAVNPMEDAVRGYAQLVKGIIQVWKFFSDARRGVFNAIPLADGAYGILLTMDAWMQMSEGLQKEAMALARKNLVDAPDITEADMKPIIFCSMQELSDIMFVSTEDQFLTTLENGISESFVGWSLREVRRKVAGEEQRHEYPLDVSELLPWWGRFQPSSHTT